MKANWQRDAHQNPKVKERYSRAQSLRHEFPVNFKVKAVGENRPTGILSYAASGIYVAISLDVALLEEYLRNTGNIPQVAS